MVTPSVARLLKRAEVARLRAEADRLEAELSGPWLDLAQRRVLRYVVATGGTVSTLDLRSSRVLSPLDYRFVESLVDLGLVEYAAPGVAAVTVTPEGRRVCSTFGKPRL